MMPGHLLRGSIYRVLTAKPFSRPVALVLETGFRRFGGSLLPRELIDGIDRYFVRDMTGNVDADGDGAPDSFRFTITNAWYDQRITGVELGLDGRRVPSRSILLRSGQEEVLASDMRALEFPPGKPVEIIAIGRALGDGLHLLDMVIDMELGPLIIPVLPVSLRGGIGDVPILEDCFRPLPEWPPTELRQGRVHVVPHIHYDVEWLQTRDVFERVGLGNLREALRLMELDEEMTFVVDQVPHLEPFRRRDPSGFERLVELVREGRIEPVNGMYCEPDVNILSGESLVRQSIGWQSYALERFGSYSRCGWLIDSFGMCSQLPQIFKKSGTDYFVYSRTLLEEGAASEFIWEGLDGSAVIAHNMPLMYSAGHPVSTERSRALRKMLKTYRHLRGRSAGDQVFYPCGVDHGRPQKEYGEMSRAWNEEVEGVKFEFSLPTRFFESLEGESLDVIRGEFQRELWGTWSSRMGLKQLNRACEFALLDAGKLSAVASMFGKAFHGRELEWAWTGLMDNQFHDQICGCSIDAVADGMRERMNELLVSTGALMRESAWHLAGRPRGTGRDAFTMLVFNPLSVPVTSWVEFEVDIPPGWSGLEVSHGGVRVPVQVLDDDRYGDGTLKHIRAGFVPELPATGFRVFDVRQASDEGPGPENPVRAAGGTLENGVLSVGVDCGTGLLESAVVSGGESFDLAGGNRLALDRDLGNLYVSGGIRNTWMYPRRVASVRLKEEGPLRGRIEVRGTVGHSEFIQHISLAAGSASVGFETFVDFKDARHRLQCVFPTGIKEGTWVHEVPYGVMERPGHELAAQNFVDLSRRERGITLVNYGIPPNERRGEKLYLTLLRSSDMIHTRYAGPGGLEIGEHKFNYSLYPHKGDHLQAGSAIESYRCNNPPRAFVFKGIAASVGTIRFSGLRCTPDDVLVSMLERNAAGETVIRFWDTTGKAREAVLELGWEASQAFKSDLLGRREQELAVNGNTVTIPVNPFEIATTIIP